MAITNALLGGDPTHLGTLAGVLPSLCSARVTLLPKTFTSATGFPGQGRVAPTSSVTFKAVRNQPRIGKAPWSKIKNLPFPIHPNFTPKRDQKTPPVMLLLVRPFWPKRLSVGAWVDPTFPQGSTPAKALPNHLWCSLKVLPSIPLQACKFTICSIICPSAPSGDPAWVTRYPRSCANVEHSSCRGPEIRVAP